MNRLYFSYLLLLLMITAGFGQGVVVDDSLYSVAMEEIRMVDVYLPEMYNPADSTTLYPVFYFMHGCCDDHEGWYQPTLKPIVDRLIGNGTINPIILVFPNARGGPYGDGNGGPGGFSWMTNSDLNGLIEDYLVYDLVEHIDTSYHTVAMRGGRFITGHSMGGYGSMKLALKHPDIFRGVLAQSGVMDLGLYLTGMTSYVLSENGGSGPFDPNAGINSAILFSLAASFSANIDLPPYYVDLPIDQQGNRIDSVFARWKSHDLPYLARQYPAEAGLEIYFDCGTLDGLHPQSAAFADSLDSLGLAHTFASHGGTHNSLLVEQFGIGLTFFDALLWEDLPKATNTVLEPSYAAPGLDSIIITTQISNPDGQNLTAFARIRHQGNAEILDTLALFDDGGHDDGVAGDGVWGGSGLSPPEESYYSLDVSAVDTDSGIVYTRYNQATFTTVGPVVYDSYTLTGPDTIPQPGDRAYFYLTLANEGSAATATNIRAELSALDTCSDVTQSSAAFGAIAPGERVEGRSYYAIRINNTCAGDHPLECALSIQSQGFTFWSDTFSVDIYPLGIAGREGVLPTEYTLHQNYPNPFNPVSTIMYDLPQASEVSLVVYDILGREVARLVDGYMEPGYHHSQWDGRDARGREVPSGIYIARLVTPEYSKSIKMLLLK
ncbi:MAG: prolyl oligopeptidase family serine peptidase [Fidelibacterota bacterium]|nr:MAG: prolyl oligopeptidase family serine peptidase [Candidatus Neomarinimicrobiota bacterium]